MPTESQTIEISTELPLPRLQPGQEIFHIEEYKGVLRSHDKPPSAIRELMKLAGVEFSLEIGNNGPVVASRATEGNKGIDSLGLFETEFGRDSLIVAQLLFDKFPKLAKATVTRACELQGIGSNKTSEEEPGRIFHEYRDHRDPLGRKLTAEKGWKWPYYGTVDATPLFIQTIAKIAKRNPQLLYENYKGRDNQTHTIEYALRKSLDWLEKRLDSNKEGLLEFKRVNPQGIENQVWKDSPDSYFHTDGTLANHEQGIASIEVQALAYDALIDAAEVFEQIPLKKDRDYRLRAAKLREVVLDKFWVEDERGGYFALGSDRNEDGNLKIMEVRTSNMGRLLNSRILEGNDPEIIEKREKLIKTLFSEEMLAAAGIRTLSSKEARYSPGAYHNGSVWLFDTYLIALGLERHGYFGLAHELKNRLFEVVKKTNLFPEFVRGESDKIVLNTREIFIGDKNHVPDTQSLEEIKKLPKIEQPPQEIQAWTVAALLREKYARYRLGPKTDQKLTIALDWEKRKLELELLRNIRQPQNTNTVDKNGSVVKLLNF